MSQHTPGPWKVGQYLGSPSSYCVHMDAEDKGRGIDVVEAVAGISAEQRLANARLIAAAPDLLQACQTFAEWLRREEDGFVAAGKTRDTPEGEAEWRSWFYENLHLCDLAQQQARDAISKATGGELA